jgi:hypothetical protein
MTGPATVIRVFDAHLSDYAERYLGDSLGGF